MIGRRLLGFIVMFGMAAAVFAAFFVSIYAITCFLAWDIISVDPLAASVLARVLLLVVTVIALAFACSDEVVQ